MPDVTLTVDGKKVTAPAGTLLIEACKTVGIEVPSFCYYPNLSLQGACRMLLNAGEEARTGGSRIALVIGVPGMIVGSTIVAWVLLKRSGTGDVAIGSLPGDPKTIGWLLFHDFLLPFEVTSVLILIAIMTLTGAFQARAVYGIIAATGVIWSACYLLWMYQRVFYGKVTHPENNSLLDLSRREQLALWPTAVAALVMGVAPLLWLNIINPAVETLLPVSQMVSKVAGQ